MSKRKFVCKYLLRILKSVIYTKFLHINIGCGPMARETKGCPAVPRILRKFHMNSDVAPMTRDARGCPKALLPPMVVVTGPSTIGMIEELKACVLNMATL